MGIAALVIFSGALWIDDLYDRIREMKTNDLKYRYIQMMGGIDEPALHGLNALFYDSSHSQDRRALRRQIERHETAVREAIESQQRATLKVQQAEELKEKARQQEPNIAQCRLFNDSRLCATQFSISISTLYGS